jgi:hypothetical protein
VRHGFDAFVTDTASAIDSRIFASSLSVFAMSRLWRAPVPRKLRREVGSSHLQHADHDSARHDLGRRMGQPIEARFKRNIVRRPRSEAAIQASEPASTRHCASSRSTPYLAEDLHELSLD